MIRNINGKDGQVTCGSNASFSGGNLLADPWSAICDGRDSAASLAEGTGLYRLD